MQKCLTLRVSTKEIFPSLHLQKICNVIFSDMERFLDVAINLEGMLLVLEGILGEIVAVGKLLDQLGQQVVIPIMQRHLSQH